MSATHDLLKRLIEMNIANENISRDNWGLWPEITMGMSIVCLLFSGLVVMPEIIKTILICFGVSLYLIGFMGLSLSEDS